jgi:hypothetical protein
MERAEPKNLLERRVLEWCNSIRAKRRLRPRDSFVKGIRENNCFECLLARTLGNGYQVLSDGTLSHNSDPYKDIKMPKFVHNFERRFEAGLYPHLVEN